jgi:hypothetical protein
MYPDKGTPPVSLGFCQFRVTESRLMKSMVSFTGAPGRPFGFFGFTGSVSSRLLPLPSSFSAATRKKYESRLFSPDTT